MSKEKTQTVILVVHGTPTNFNEQNRYNADRAMIGLSHKIKKHFNGQTPQIWHSPAKGAIEMVTRMRKFLPEVVVEQPKELQEETLGMESMKWLKEKLDTFEQQNLVLVVDQKFVNKFPMMYAWQPNDAGFGNAIILSRKKGTRMSCEFFPEN